LFLLNGVIEEEAYVEQPQQGNSKRLINGSIDRYKARIGARGFSQKEGEDYDDSLFQ
jgi:hypothetical protein